MNEALIALIIQLAAHDAKVDPNLLAAVVEVESGNNPNAYKPRDGHSASYGLAQVKCGTARELGYTGECAALQDPYLSAYYGGRYLSSQYKRYRSVCRAVGAYNAGNFKMAVDKKPKNWYYIEKVFSAYNRRSGTRPIQANIRTCSASRHVH